MRLVGWGLPINFTWEMAQSPLYADHGGGWPYVLWTRFHCTLGDVLILLGAFWATAVAYRSRQWPWSGRATAPLLFVGFGLAYTVWSEWFNTRVREAWAYTAEMPTLFGIGLAPLAQWLIIPTLLVWGLRRRRE